jgi:hypothetical protein
MAPKPGAAFAFLEGTMPGQDRYEQIRALIEEADRVRSESEKVTGYLDQSMKQPFWPERRRNSRVPAPSDRERNSER